MLTHQSAQSSEKAEELFQQGDYQEAENVYRQLIERHPTVRVFYWKLGLALLLQEQEADAQMCWMSVLMDASEAEAAEWGEELASVLDSEAQRQQQLNDIPKSWLIRQHLREIQPENINNLIILICLCIKINHPIVELLTDESGLLELLSNPENQHVDIALLLDALPPILKSLEITEAILPLVTHILNRAPHPHDVRNKLIPVCLDLQNQSRFKEAISIGEQYLATDPGDLEFLAHLPGWYDNIKDLPQAIKTATRRITLCEDSPAEEIFSRHLLIKVLLGSGGHWNESLREVEANQTALLSIERFKRAPSLFQILRLFSTSFFYPYISDDPIQNRKITNHVACLLSNEIRKITPPELEQRYLQRRLSEKLEPSHQPGRKLKIGYISYCLKRHSVGWIARWLIQHHDRQAFQIYGYLINFNESNPFQLWYLKQFDHACRVGLDCPDTGLDIAQQISQDEIDILVDLDSITMDFSCEVMVHKPAPVQVSWLGWDASGIPQIDYYIADSYVLPDDAKDYYQEKIWRLPDTYVAVNGFEVEVPTISRASLGIPQDAITYLTAQGGYKRNPTIIRLQLSVIKAVPKSFLLVKGTGNTEAIQNHFYTLAEEVGVEKDRLIFLPIVSSEEKHRANLRIADIILDTYPYNGATTTLETLWMEIPLVTLVGKQFSARNSYTMLRNVGVEEGIAWNEQEYIDWGIRLGIEPQLRQKVVWKLREAKKSAPLWNAKAFTRNMEKAYQEMWSKYLEDGPTSEKPVFAD